MTDQELKDCVASLAVSQKETDLQLRETDLQLKETSQKLKELGLQGERRSAEVSLQQAEVSLQQKETSQQLKELGKQIGGLGNKFGSFTEGMAFPSMKKILSEQFKMENICANVSSRRAGGVMELDVLAYANTEVNAIYVVEVKSELRETHLSRFLEVLKRFPQFFPEIYQGKELYGVLAYVSGREEFKQQILDEGLYLAEIHGDLFQIQSPSNFQARAF